jgi:hypothetical protein
MEAIILIVGVYLLAVGFHGNGGALGDEILGQKGFLAWLIALVLVAMLAYNKRTAPLAEPLMIAVILGILVVNYQTIFPDIEALLHDIGG